MNESLKIERQRRIRSHTAGLVLAAIHTLIVLVSMETHVEGSWGALPVMLIDLPVSLLFIPIANAGINHWAVFLVLGGVWWLFLGSMAQSIFSDLINRNRRENS